MVKITLKGFKEAINGLKNMASNTPKNIDTELDNAGKEVKDKMTSEAPVRGGALKRSIKVSRTKKFVREIEPFATNLAGEKYAAFVEEGTGEQGGQGNYFPNVTSIAVSMGVSMKMAWAIAFSIAGERGKTGGTKANPFISRTLDWTNDQLDNWGGHIVARLENDFARG